MRANPILHGHSFADRQTCADGAVAGMARALALARAGRLISAIKHLEATNPALARERAKAIVNSFGYRTKEIWPEAFEKPIRCM